VDTHASRILASRRARLKRFEAERELRDHVLSTTVSQLADRGVRILRREETVPGAFGDVRCMRYAIAAESIERARELLGLQTAGAPPAARSDLTALATARASP